MSRVAEAAWEIATAPDQLSLSPQRFKDYLARLFAAQTVDTARANGAAVHSRRQPVSRKLGGEARGL